MTASNSIHFPIPPQFSPYVLYRFFDAEGTLIYVGITNDLKRRCTEHRQKAWFTEVARVDATGCNTQAQASALESLVISEHAPLYNRAGGTATSASSPGRPAVAAKHVSVKVPISLHQWLQAQSMMSGLEVTEVILRHLERAWEMDGLAPELSVQRYR